MNQYMLPIGLFVGGTLIGGPGLGVLLLLIWVVIRLTKNPPK